VRFAIQQADRLACNYSQARVHRFALRAKTPKTAVLLAREDCSANSNARWYRGEGRPGTLLGIKGREKASGTLGRERCRRTIMRIDMVGVAIARAKHTHAHERAGRPEKPSPFHAEESLPAHLFVNRSTECAYRCLPVSRRS
jgi:hypothetical protein